MSSWQKWQLQGNEKGGDEEKDGGGIARHKTKGEDRNVSAARARWPKSPTCREEADGAILVPFSDIMWAEECWMPEQLNKLMIDPNKPSPFLTLPTQLIYLLDFPAAAEASSFRQTHAERLLRGET